MGTATGPEAIAKMVAAGFERMSPTLYTNSNHVMSSFDIEVDGDTATAWSRWTWVVVGANGKPQPFIMGCYGIGLNRIMAAAIESSHDDKGIIWPMSIAPFHVVICALDTREQAVVETAERLERELEAAGVEVLLDDRDARPGFKFADADLIGFPIRITVGKKGLAEGIVEVVNRKTGDVQKVAPADCVSTDGVVSCNHSRIVGIDSSADCAWSNRPTLRAVTSAPASDISRAVVNASTGGTSTSSSP